MTAQLQINVFLEGEMTAEEAAYREEVVKVTCSLFYIPKEHMSWAYSSPPGRRRRGVAALLKPGAVPALL